MNKSLDCILAQTPSTLLAASLLIFIPCLAVGQQTVSYDQAQVTLINNVKIAAKDPGIVEQVLVEHGTKIEAGQVVVKLDSNLYLAQNQSAKFEREIAELQAANDINYRFAKKSAEVNQKVLERSRNARTRYQDSVSETEIEQLELSLQQSVLSIEQAELEKGVNDLTVGLRISQQAIANERLTNRDVRAPLSGTVVDSFVQPGEWVNSGQPIARIINLEKLRVKAVYDAKHYGRIDKNSPVTFAIPGDNRLQRNASIYFISPEIDPTNQDFQIWADIQNDDRKVLPGMKGVLTIQLK